MIIQQYISGEKTSVSMLLTIWTQIIQNCYIVNNMGTEKIGPIYRHHQIMDKKEQDKTDISSSIRAQQIIDQYSVVQEHG